MASATSFYDFKPKDKKGQPYDLTAHRNQVLLLVNTATACGFTPQLTGLETLYQTFQKSHPDRFLVLGFPSNQFNQEARDDDGIQTFCQRDYGVSFPILGKTAVNGDGAEPLWEFMKKEKTSLGLKRVKWNFEKFLVSGTGEVVARWTTATKPEALEGAIREELAKLEVAAGGGGAKKAGL